MPEQLAHLLTHLFAYVPSIQEQLAHLLTHHALNIFYFYFYNDDDEFYNDDVFASLTWFLYIF
jgi:hypothetical protein